jgi:hypothetical protein
MTNWGVDQLTAPGGCWQKSSEHITAQIDPKRIACNLLLEHSFTFWFYRQLVYRLLNPLSFVAFKMGRLRGGPSRTGAEGASSTSLTFAGSELVCAARRQTGAGRN